MTTSNGSVDTKKSPLPLRDEGKVWPQVLTILIACMVPMTAGLLFSWSSPFIVKITNDKTDYNITEEEASYFTVIPPIVMIITSLLFTNLNDVIGRKFTAMLIAIPYSLAWVFAAVAKNIWVFYVSRILAGMGDGLMFSTIPMYIGEVSTPKVRGLWGNALTFFIYVGQLLINVIGSYCSVQQTSYICICFPLVFLVLFSFMPESPYFYIMKGKFEEARVSLRRLRRKKNVEDDFVLLKADVDRQMTETGTWKDLFTIDSNRRALFAGVFLRTSQQFAGISSFAVYTQYIFAKSGGDLNPQVSSIIFFGAICVLNLVGAYILDLFGRRMCYLVSIFFCGVVLFVETAYFYVEQFDVGIDISSLNWIPLTGMMVYVVFYSIGVGIVPTLMLGELFSASIKPKGLGCLSIIFGVLVCVITKVFHLMTSNFGLFAPFLLFSLSCFVSTVLGWYLIPETKGKTLEEIQQSLKGPRLKNKSVK